jgi:hypothetical protein
MPLFMNGQKVIRTSPSELLQNEAISLIVKVVRVFWRMENKIPLSGNDQDRGKSFND